MGGNGAAVPISPRRIEGNGAAVPISPRGNDGNGAAVPFGARANDWNSVGVPIVPSSTDGNCAAVSLNDCTTDVNGCAVSFTLASAVSCGRLTTSYRGLAYGVECAEAHRKLAGVLKHALLDCKNERTWISQWLLRVNLIGA